MPKTETSTQDSARPTPSAIETKKPVFSMSKLAPEIILIILSSLDYYDNPSRLLPILIMCKSWARLALELIYEQPFLTLKSIPSFITTLGLQDRLQDGKTPFWETNIHLDGVKSLGIDYRSLIKKPCRIVGSSPTKLDLVQLWDLQAVLWTVPGLAVSRGSINTGLSLSNGTSSPSSSPPQSPLSLSSSPTSPVQSSPSPSPRLLSPMPTSTVAAAATTVTASVVRTAEAGSIEVTRPISPPRRTASSSPSTPKPVLVRRKKKALPPPGPIVMMLESTAVYSEILNEVLREVPGMKLRHLHYRLIPNIPLLELLKNHISTLQELTITRSPIRITEFAAIAQEISGSTNTINNCSSSSNGGGHEDAVNGTVAVQEQYPQTRHQSHIHTLALNFCQGAGMTVLTDLMRACGPRLRTLEFRKHTVVRPVAGAAGEGVNDPAQAPINVFGGNWDEQERAREAFERELKEFPSKSTCEPGQVCKGCGSVDKSCHNSDQTQLDDKTETTVNDLFIAMPTEATSVNEAESNVEQQQEQQQQHQQGAGSHPVGVDPETRMDLAMLAISENCPGLTCLRLQNMTWLTDNSLSGFQPADNIFPTVHSQQQKQQQYDQQHRGLKEIELLNSYYGSKVTIEGLLEICGPELETLVIDQESCWRTRVPTWSPRTPVSDQGVNTSPPGTLGRLHPSALGLCTGCTDKERLRSFKDGIMSSGDRIISGLLPSRAATKSTAMSKSSIKIRRLARQDSCSIQQLQQQHQETVVTEEEEEDEKKKKGEEEIKQRQRPRRLRTLVLIEHWVSVQIFKEVLQEWSQTLAVVSLCLYKCSNEELEDALVPKEFIKPGNPKQKETALQTLQLSLPWIPFNETEERLTGVVDKVFEAHAGLSRVEINRRIWRRKSMALSPSLFSA